MTVLATRGRLQLESGPDGGLGLADQGRVDLFGVTVTQHAGGPLVPLVFRSEHLVGRVELEAFETPGDVEGVIEGAGLSGRGRGLRFDGKGGTFSLLQGGSVLFSEQTDHPVSFSTPENGPLHMRRVDETHLEIRASGGVEFGLVSEPEGRVTAREAELFARIDDEDVLIETATVEGDVEAMRGTDRFACDEARLVFGEENVLRELDLEGRAGVAAHHRERRGGPGRDRGRGRRTPRDRLARCAPIRHARGVRVPSAEPRPRRPGRGGDERIGERGRGAG